MDSLMQRVLKGKTQKPKLVLLGAGGLSSVVAQVARHQGKYEVVGFCDDKFTSIKIEDDLFFAPFSEVVELLKNPETVFILAVGEGRIRSQIFDRVQIPRQRYVNVIHPLAYIDTDVELGTGNLISPYAILHSGVRIGDHCTVNSASVVEHKSQLGSFVSLSPNVTITGEVTIGDLCFIGAGSVIIQCLTVGKNTLIGAGSLVIRDQPANSVAFGSPAKVVRKND
ncbi:acetyltransferase [Companilactobacillus sp. RD055328]|uniref:acetyltransferase n=1 Tax=Companilactobacillus sp. RD055328 TaxID=2916634 RepID=UPI001FC89A05|nr:acetyltransferase [Companilactobacillus sp. RD055328]GKQ43363.1 acetyltransferase [Companilactobacillus sp. RD055328]